MGKLGTWFVDVEPTAKFKAFVSVSGPDNLIAALAETTNPHLINKVQGMIVAEVLNLLH